MGQEYDLQALRTLISSMSKIKLDKRLYSIPIQF
jgi:hypothetical protein